MFEVLKPLLDQRLISEEVETELKEAWDNQLSEATEKVRTEIREEFAERYEHDRKNLVEALDNMVTENLAKEINEFVEDKRGVVEAKVAYTKAIKEHSEKMKKFVLESLAKEMSEFYADKKHQEENVAKMEQFVIEMLGNEITEFKQDKNKMNESFNSLENFVFKSLSEEIAEFTQDKKELIETKVALVDKAQTKLEELRKQFIRRSAKLVEETVTKTIRSEMTQLKEDIEHAKRNEFGREIFEAFAATYVTSHLNETSEVSKLKRENTAMAVQLEEAQIRISESQDTIKEREARIRVIKENSDRKEIVSELLSPLSKDKKAIMNQLLDNVKTENLRESFDKYLPSVLETGSGSNGKIRKLMEDRKPSKKVVKEVTGDRETKEAPVATNDDEMKSILNLAGLKN